MAGSLELISRLHLQVNLVCSKEELVLVWMTTAGPSWAIDQLAVRVPAVTASVGLFSGLKLATMTPSLLTALKTRIAE